MGRIWAADTPPPTHIWSTKSCGNSQAVVKPPRGSFCFFFLPLTATTFTREPNMSVNQIECPVKPYAGETWVYQCPLPTSRISLSGKTIGSSSSSSRSSSSTEGGELSSSSGQLYLSTRRLVYIPSASETSSPPRHRVFGRGDRNFESLSVPLDRISSTQLQQPWIGPSGWVCLVSPLAGGGLEPETLAWQLKLVFRDGGVYEFVEAYERSQRARQAGQSHIEELPEYSEG